MGKPRDFRYGIIRSIGNQHNGFQRNIEVALISQVSDTTAPLVSLYPAYSLTSAHLSTIYDPKAMKSTLCSRISQLTNISNFKVNVEELVEETKLLVNIINLYCFSFFLH